MALVRLEKGVERLSMNSNTDQNHPLHIPPFQPFHAVHEYNVLLLGETQAGKSTFIQATRQYADPAYKKIEGIIGNGITSCTDTVKRYSVITNLPSCDVVETMHANGKNFHRKIDYGRFPFDMDVDDYEDAINKRKPFTLQHGNSFAEDFTFNLYDTPGLNDTNSKDELHVANIFDKIREAGKIHLVLIMVGKGPFSPGLKSAIRCYLDIFPQFNGIMAFVHTKIDYEDLHPDKHKFKEYMDEKKSVIHEIMNRNSFTHFWIDCNLESNKPIRKCITHNTIRKILKVAMLNRPISLKATLMCKTPKMRETDSLVKDKYESMSKVMEDTLRFKNTEEGNTLADIYSLNSSIVSNESEEKNNQLYIASNATDEFELLDEIRYDDTWGLFSDLFNRIPHEVATLQEQDFVIDHMDLLNHGFTLDETEGGKGEKFWRTRFKRKSFQNGVLHAKFYVRKRNKYRQEISRKTTQQFELAEKRRLLAKEREAHAERSKKQRAEIADLVKKNNEYMQIVSIVKEEQMKPEVFRALAEAGAYLGTPSENLQKVVEVYTRVLEEQSDLMTDCDSDTGATVDNSMESDDEDNSSQITEP